MTTLQDILANAQHGDAVNLLGKAYDLTPEQTESAVAALLPAISMGLKRSTATPEGLGELFAVVGQQPDLYGMYEDPDAALSPEGVAAGNAVLANMFGSPEVSRAVANQAQQLSGVGGAILKKILPVIVGMLLSGLMRGGSGQAAPAPAPMPRQPRPAPGGGGLFDIFREIFQQGAGGGSSSEPGQPGQSPVPPIGDILDSIGDGRQATANPSTPKFPMPDYRQQHVPDSAPQSMPDQPAPGGDIFGQILNELGKAVREGRVKPVIVGPGGAGVPGRQAPQGGQAQSPGPQSSGGSIFGEILREVLGGAMGQTRPPRHGLMEQTGAGAMVFGNALDPDTRVGQHHADSLQEIFTRFDAGLPPQAD